MTTPEVTEEKHGFSRRDLIKKGAVAGAIVWTVPMIQSVPAYAAGGSQITTTCSYFVLVYIKNGVTYADRVSSTGACGGPQTSADVSWCYTCPDGHSYDNVGARTGGGTADILEQNGVSLSGSGCTAGDGTFNVSGNTITPGSGVTIIFAVASAGSLTN